MANEYVTRDEFKASHSLTGKTFADEDIDIALAAASRGIDHECERVFYELDPSNDQTRYYSPAGARSLFIDDLCGVTSIELDPNGDGVFEVELDVNQGFVLEPLNAAADGRPWTHIELHPNCVHSFPTAYPRSVKIVGHFGWLAVPDVVKQATSILAHRLLKRGRDAAFGVAGFGPDGSSVRIAQSDPDVAALIQPLSRRVPFA